MGGGRKGAAPKPFSSFHHSRAAADLDTNTPPLREPWQQRSMPLYVPPSSSSRGEGSLFLASAPFLLLHAGHQRPPFPCFWTQQQTRRCLSSSSKQQPRESLIPSSCSSRRRLLLPLQSSPHFLPAIPKQQLPRIQVVPHLSCPIALFSYYNPILKQGVENFMSTIKNVGVNGLVVPDVPLEETGILRNEAAKQSIELVLLTTPTTPTDRMKRIVEASEGFVYLVSSVGVTGTRSSVSLRVQTLLQEIKEASNKPVAVGFGISTPEHVKQIAGWGADGVIVGSAMVKILGDTKPPEERLKELEDFTKSLKAALL